jgi:hypothetical protein
MAAIESDRALITAIDIELDDIREITRHHCESRPTGNRDNRGRAAFTRLEYFIAYFGSFYENRGGKVSANYIGKRLKGKPRKRGGPFISFMLKLNSFLPEEIRFSETAFAERIATILRRRKTG